MENVTNESDEFLLLDNWNDPTASQFEINNPIQLHSQSTNDLTIDKYIFEALGSSQPLNSIDEQSSAYDSMWSTPNPNECEQDRSPYFLQNLSTNTTTSLVEEIVSPYLLGSNKGASQPYQPSSYTSSESSWEVQQIQHIIDSSTNPIGKFLRNAHISAELAAKAKIMPFLVQAPRKLRGKYGKRRKLTEAERNEISRQRNRDHAQATRQRRKVFKAILAIRHTLDSGSADTLIQDWGNLGNKRRKF